MILGEVLCLLLFYFKKINPEFVIESGVYKGQTVN